MTLTFKMLFPEIPCKSILALEVLTFHSCPKFSPFEAYATAAAESLSLHCSTSANISSNGYLETSFLSTILFFFSWQVLWNPYSEFSNKVTCLHLS